MVVKINFHKVSVNSHFLCVIFVLLICPWPSVAQSFWCMNIQNYFAGVLRATGCNPPWTSSANQCGSMQTQYKALLPAFGCQFTMPQPPCNAVSGARCVPEAWACTQSTGACGTAGTKCCGPVNGQCDCRNGQSCLLPMECAGVPGAVVNADKACYAAPTTNYVCCQEPTCDTRVGDRCVPSDYVCTTSNSGPCRAGYQCCRQPTGQCGVGQDQACKTVRECWSRPGTSILADLTCADSSQICCHDPPPPVCDAGSGDRCLPDTWTCTTSSSGPCSSPGTKCCGPSTGPCAGDGRACGKIASQCLAISGAAVIADLQCGDSSEVCCHVPVPPTVACGSQPEAGRSCCRSQASCGSHATAVVDPDSFVCPSPQVCCNVTDTPSVMNVAVNKPASQSSLYITSDGTEFSAGYAVDGNLDGDFRKKKCAGTKSTEADGSWWQVDLESNYAIYAVKIYNRQDCCSNRLRNFTITVYQDDPVQNAAAAGVVCLTYPGISVKALYGQLLDCDCDVVPVIGRYLRLTNTPEREYLQLCEVEVMAQPA